MNSATPELRALAFDFGERRIGVASANTVTSTSSALGAVEARSGEPDWRALDALVTEWQPNVIIVGLPCHIDGSESTISAKARAFGALLTDRYALPVTMVDERLTSAQAAQELRELRRSGVRRRRVSKSDIDSLSAQLIAESWLTGLKNDKTKD